MLKKTYLHYYLHLFEHFDVTIYKQSIKVTIDKHIKIHLKRRDYKTSTFRFTVTRVFYYIYIINQFYYIYIINSLQNIIQLN